MSNVLSRVLSAAAAAAGVLIAPGVAAADPTPPPGPPPPPNVLALAPISPVEFTAGNGVYAFTVPVGVTCVMSKFSRAYGCSGAMPGAPVGANVVTGTTSGGEPGFSTTDRPLYHFDTPPPELPVGSRLGMDTVSCGALDGGAVACSNTFDQTGFVIGPGGTFTFGAVNPLLDRPQGTNPYFN